jgi:hypothetical protein
VNTGRTVQLLLLAEEETVLHSMIDALVVRGQPWPEFGVGVTLSVRLYRFVISFIHYRSEHQTLSTLTL